MFLTLKGTSLRDYVYLSH